MLSFVEHSVGPLSPIFHLNSILFFRSVFVLGAREFVATVIVNLDSVCLMQMRPGAAGGEHFF
jgi:hypothetical protein